MMNSELQDIRSYLLRWLIPFTFGLLWVSLLFLFIVNPLRAYEARIYTVLISSLLVLCIIAYYFHRKENYSLSSSVIILLAIVGAWGSIVIDHLDGIESFFPLAYLTIPVAFSSLLFPLLFTISLSVVQFIFLVIVVSRSKILLGSDWESFLAYVLIVSILSIVANYIIKLQLRQFKEGSIKDHLTGLFNRRYFDATLENSIKRGQSKKLTFGVIMLDIDSFKSFNDTYGHGTGDSLLALVAHFLLDEVGLSDIVCRYGGDEFALIISQSTPKKLYEFAEGLRLEIKRSDKTQLDPRFKHVTISMGLAMFPLSGKTKGDLMAIADKNLLVAKDLGKDKVVFQ